MKALYVPLFLLGSLLVVSLWVNSGVQRDAQQWIGAVDGMIELLEDDKWSGIEDQILDLYGKWDQRKTTFHMIMEHQYLDDAEELFAGAFAACREQDSVELHILLEQLKTQLMFLAETQQANVKNIL